MIFLASFQKIMVLAEGRIALTSDSFCFPKWSLLVGKDGSEETSEEVNSLPPSGHRSFFVNLFRIPSD
jgi:hypothetical protein